MLLYETINNELVPCAQRIDKKYQLKRVFENKIIANQVKFNCVDDYFWCC